MKLADAGTLRVLELKDIKISERYREEFGDLDALAESIKEKGIIQPISVNSDLRLLAGERRVRAALKAGLTKIPALVRKGNDALDAREIELMENIYRQDFTWAEKCKAVQDIDKLYKEKHLDWSGRKTAELLNRGVGSVNRYLQLATAMEFIPELEDQATADDAFKLLKKMEEHQIVHELRNRQQTEGSGLDKGVKAMLRVADANYKIGDTFKGLAELRTQGVVNLIECDPPYGIDLKQLKRSKDSVDSNIHGYNEIDQDAYPAFLEKLARELHRVAGQHCWLVFWFGPTWQHEVRTALVKAGWLVDDIPCVWTKKQGQTMQPSTYLGRAYEPFYLARKGNAVIAKPGRLNVFEYPGATGKSHPTERPLPLMEDILETLVFPRAVVLVPFLGSGNSLRAAYKTGMIGFGWDISAEYKDVFMLNVESDSRHLNDEPIEPIEEDE